MFDQFSLCTDEGSWMLPKLQFAICLIVYWRSKRCFSLLSFAPSFISLLFPNILLLTFYLIILFLKLIITYERNLKIFIFKNVSMLFINYFKKSFYKKYFNSFGTPILMCKRKKNILFHTIQHIYIHNYFEFFLK